MRFCVQMSETEKDVKVALWYKGLFTLLVSKSVCSLPAWKSVFHVMSHVKAVKVLGRQHWYFYYHFV